MNMKTAGVSLVMMVSLVGGVWAGTYSGGTGEPNDPYRISTPNDLNDIGNHVEDWVSHFVMVNDVNLAEFTGTQFNIIGNYPSNPFTGVFDGNGHTISNFTYNSSGRRKTGIFGYVYGANAWIKNVSIIDPNVNSGTGWEAGALFGYLKNGHVYNCYIEGGRVSGRFYVAGLGGSSNGGTVSNSYSTALISADDQAGGLIGSMSPSGIISNCYASGDVSADGVDEEVSAVGGLVAYIGSGTISNCYASGDVSGIDRPSGGLIGVVSGDSVVTNSYASGDVSAVDNSSGGLIGKSNATSGVVLNCYASGQVSSTMGSAEGGLIGSHFGGGSYTKCFWDSTVNSGLDGIGNGSDPNVIGKTTAEMKTESTFTDAGWDFVNVWGIGEGQTYPFLRNHIVGDLNHDGVVDGRDFAIFALHWLEETN
jgi:hypothetical protein